MSDRPTTDRQRVVNPISRQHVSRQFERWSTSNGKHYVGPQAVTRNGLAEVEWCWSCGGWQPKGHDV